MSVCVCVHMGSMEFAMYAKKVAKTKITVNVIISPKSASMVNGLQLNAANHHKIETVQGRKKGLL